MSDVILEVKEVSKKFGPTVALDNVSICIERGEIHGLIGENGSGKSTISAIISGMLNADSGIILYKNKEWKPHNMLEAQKNGISMIVQEAGTIPLLTVAENIFLGMEERFSKGPFVNRGRLQEEAAKALGNIGIGDVHPGQSMMELDIQKRKMIEIARVMCDDPELLIIDETTTALSHQGRQQLYQLMHQMKQKGKAVLMISHDLDEIMEYCNKLTVLRDGKIITSFNKEEYNPAEIRQSMIGREISGEYYRSDFEGFDQMVTLSAKNITTLHGIQNINLELHRGEILGIGGLSECGMHELGKALYGDEPILKGSVMLKTHGEIPVRDTAAAQKMGMAYISKDRDRESLALESPIYNNMASTGYRKNRSVGPFISFKKEKKYVDDQLKNLSIKCRNRYQEPKELSGGNKQKVVFGKWVASDADVLIMDCPTRGVDIGVKADMYQLMVKMKKVGKSIVMISEELSELIGMCDRILILKDGSISGEYHRSEGLSESKLIEAMI